MGVFCDRLKLCSTAAPDCQTGQNKGRYREQERSFLLVSLALKDILSCVCVMFLSICFLAVNKVHYNIPSNHLKDLKMAFS